MKCCRAFFAGLGFFALGCPLTAGNPASLPSTNESGSSLREEFGGSKKNPAGLPTAREAGSSLKESPPASTQKNISAPSSKSCAENLKSEKSSASSKSAKDKAAAFEKKEAIIKSDSRQGGLSESTVKDYLSTLDAAEKTLFESIVEKYLGRSFDAPSAASTAVLELHGLLKARLAPLNGVE